MYEHNLNPIAFSFYNLKIYWYSLAYIFGFLFSFWYSKYLVKNKVIMLDIKIIDDLITLAIIAVILGGRFGYIIFYNLGYYLENPFETEFQDVATPENAANRDLKSAYADNNEIKAYQAEWDLNIL